MSDLPLYGLDKELAEKQAEKYDVNREREAREWIELVIGEKLKGSDFFDALKDGVALIKLLNKATGSSVKVNQSTMPFKQMENINAFLAGCTKLGVPKSDVFMTVDLYERKNLLQVVQCIYAFARHACAAPAGSRLPLLGPKLAEKRQISFSDEQLNAGKFMPTQQSGHYAAKIAQERGATQSGLIYGQSRQISDQRVGAGDTQLPTQQSGHHAATLAQERGATGSGIVYGAKREIGGVDPAKANK